MEVNKVNLNPLLAANKWPIELNFFVFQEKMNKSLPIESASENPEYKLCVSPLKWKLLNSIFKYSR